MSIDGISWWHGISWWTCVHTILWHTVFVPLTSIQLSKWFYSIYTFHIFISFLSSFPSETWLSLVSFHFPPQNICPSWCILIPDFNMPIWSFLWLYSKNLTSHHLAHYKFASREVAFKNVFVFVNRSQMNRTYFLFIQIEITRAWSVLCCLRIADGAVFECSSIILTCRLIDKHSGQWGDLFWNLTEVITAKWVRRAFVAKSKTFMIFFAFRFALLPYC